jgi:hypothetical protein
MSFRLAVLISVALLLASASASSARDRVEFRRLTPPPIAADPPQGPDAPLIEGEITAAKALRAIYGNYDTTTESAGWLADLPEIRAIMDITAAEQRELPHEPTVFPVVRVSDQIVSTPSHERYLLLTSLEWPDGFGCHACEPPVGGAIFERTPKGWRLAWSRKVIDYVGHNGTPPRETEPVRIGPDKMGFVIHSSFSSNGFTDGGLTLIAEADGELKKALELEFTSGDDTGDCYPEDHQCWSYSTKLTFARGRNPEYFDIVRVTSGTYSASRHKPIRPMQGTARYMFRNGKYTPVP